MINNLYKEDCCGCSGCYSICPKKCISMLSDTEGFLYPRVNQKLCIECNLCEKVCPTYNKVEPKDRIGIKAFAAYNKNNVIRQNSSSGGVFTALAEKVLDKNGVIFGAAFDEHLQVHHIGINNVRDLDYLRGSKYMQSNLENTYSEVKEHLIQGRTVLFSGTSCQIAGLKNYLNIDYEHLILVGILCHGTPSPKVWGKYLIYLETLAHQKVRMVHFRDKEHGWKNYSISIEYWDKSEYKELYYNNLFMKMFLENICLRPSCHACRFKDLERPEDITIGDFWGIERVAPDMDDNNGSSLLLVHTKNGYKYFTDIEDLLCSKEVDVVKALPNESDSRRSVRPHPRRNKFFEKLEDWEFTKLEIFIRKSIRFRIKNKVYHNLIKVIKFLKVIVNGT